MDECPLIIQLLQGAGKLVGAAGTPALTVYAFQTGDGVIHLHAGAEGRNALGIAVAAVEELHATDYVALGLYIDPSGAHGSAGQERSLPESSLRHVTDFRYFKHIPIPLSIQI